MLEVVEYLQANDFTVYIVSGTDRFIVRGIVYDSPLNIPMGQLIGSDETLVSSNQGDTDGLQYVFDENDQLVLGGEFLIKNLKMNKVSVIAQEIGVQPVLSFGNSTGDSSMAEYVTSNNPYKSLAFMLCCDDTVRENGSTEKANKRTSIALEMIEKIRASIDTVNTSVSVAAEEKTTQIRRNDAGEGLCLTFGRGLYSPAVFELYQETLLAVAATVARKSLCAL